MAERQYSNPREAAAANVDCKLLSVLSNRSALHIMRALAEADRPLSPREIAAALRQPHAENDLMRLATDMRAVGIAEGTPIEEGSHEVGMRTSLKPDVTIAKIAECLVQIHTLMQKTPRKPSGQKKKKK